MLIRSDARHIPLADESVQCCVTSPPYWGLRDYGNRRWVGGNDAACTHTPPGDWLNSYLNDKTSTVMGTLKNQTASKIPGWYNNDGSCPNCGAVIGDYGIGLEPTFEEHIENLVAVFREVWRVLRKDGTCWLNYGDAYASNTGSGFRPGSGRADGIVAEASPRNRNGSRPISGLKPKDLMFMPVRLALALQADGWWVRSKIIWHKPNPMPESTTDRPTNAYEEMFLLSKSGDKLFWTHRAFPGVRVQPAPDYVFRLWEKVNGQRVLKKETPIEPPGWRDDDNWQRVNLWVGHDYFYDAEAVRCGDQLHRKHGLTLAGRRAEELGRPLTKREKGLLHEDGKPDKEEYTVGANLRNVWTIPTQGVSAAHFATFPEKLVEPCILAGTSAEGACAKCGAPWTRVTTDQFERTGPDRYNMDESSGWPGFPRGTTHHTTTGWKPTCECGAPTVPCTVLDPFVGSGTTLRVATRFNRQGIGCDLTYQDIAKKRTSKVQRELPLG